jgi:hypothetical protein
MKRFACAITADGQPDGVLLLPIAIDSRLLLPDQTVPYRKISPWTTGLSRPHSRTRKDVSHRAQQSILGSSVQLFEQVGVPNAGLADLVVVASVPVDVADRHEGQRVILTADVTFRAYRYRVRDVVPARRGVRFAIPGSAFDVTSASASISGATVLLREARVEFGDQPFSPLSMPTFVLRNTARHEAFVLRQASGRSRAALILNFLRTGAGVFSETWHVPASPDAAQRRIDEAWLADAELVCLDLEDLGTFQRPLQAEFVLTM